MPVHHGAEAFERAIAERGTAALDEEAEIAVFEGTRRAAAALLRASADDVAIVSSATLAVGQIAWWVRPGAGTNVVVIDLDFPSLTYPWLRLAEETGVEVRFVRRKQREPAALSLEDIRSLVDHRTAVVCVSHVQFATGHRFHPGELATLAHEHGGVLVLDASQSAGAVPLDVGADEVDFLVATSYKWLSGSFGAALWYVRPDLRERFRPPLVGWRSVLEPYELDAVAMPLAPSARKVEFSTSGYGAGAALGGAIEYVLDIGVERIMAHNLSLAGRLADGLEALGATLVTPRGDDRRSGIVAARFPGREASEIAAQLNAAGVIVSSRLGGTRFSLHYFNDASDVDRALTMVKSIV
jgi:selenocysteine lyase/cysteine desulfurase